jgi:hypothetical protein
MPLYRIAENQIVAVERTTYEALGIRERQDLQLMFKNNIEVIAPGVLVVAEEFGDWDDSRRRIDLLGVDRNANLVVVELKRTEDGGHMELQALRYAAMISSLTFSKLEAIYSTYLAKNQIDLDARDSLLQFLEWEEVDEDQFAQEVKIVLASSEFSKELTTTVMWLNEFGLDVRCVRMHPYTADNQTYLDIQTVIPIPEAEDYQIRIREKKQKEREGRSSSRDFSKFDLTIGDETHPNLSKRWLMFQLVSGVLKRGAMPNDVIEAFPTRTNNLFDVFDGTLTEDDVVEKIMEKDTGGQVPRHKRFFSDEGQFFHFDDQTYVLSNQWGIKEMDGVERLIEKFVDMQISIKSSD